MANLLVNRYVRDLAWILTSSQMMQVANPVDRQSTDANGHRGINNPLKMWLAELDRNPQLIENHLADKNLRMLGPYFEALWQFYLCHFPGKQLLAKNLQVFDDNTTLGEFDFIYFNQADSQYRHLEVAVKYYLGIPSQEISQAKQSFAADIKGTLPSGSLQSCWIGPGSRDRLDKKYCKIIQHQANLSNTPAGREAIQSLAVGDRSISRVETEICLLGYLFYPFNTTLKPPQMVDPEHSRGQWLKLSQLELFLQSESLWLILAKPHWLAPILASSAELLSNRELSTLLQQRIESQQRPILLARFEQVASGIGLLNNNTQIESQELVFVVPEDWPRRNNPHNPG